MHMVMVGAERVLSGILDQMAVNLQLGQTQFVRATQSYQGATTWLAEKDSPLHAYSPHLFPQGSLALDTTVRPISAAEFDLDVVCLVNLGRKCKPEDLYRLIWDRMYGHGTYRPLMERKPRCIRLNYAEDSQFHLDIVPAIPDYERGGSYILIPDAAADGEGMTLKTSNPRGFKRWFDEQKVVLDIKEARARIDPLAKPLPAEQKVALTKSVQMVKRWRDVLWQDDMDVATPSIVLTYLSALVYRGQGSLAEAFDGILDGLIQYADGGSKTIYSPVNDVEVISEKWLRNPDSHDAFVEGVRQLRSDWDEVLGIAEDSRSGFGPLTEKLKTLFGDPAVVAVKDAVYAPVERARQDGTMAVEKKTGHIVTATVPAAVRPSYAPYKRQTFYGD